MALVTSVLNTQTELGLVDSSGNLTFMGAFSLIILITLIAAFILIMLMRYFSDDDGEDDLARYIYYSQGSSTQKTLNEQSKAINMENKYDGMNTAVLIRAILEDLNCKYEENDDGSDLIFSYQGETFVARAPLVDNPRIRLFDVNWYSCPLENLEEMSCMQKAINEGNTHQMCTAVYYIDNENKCMTVYSKADFLIWSAMPQPDNFMRMWLDNMFYLKQDIVAEFERGKQKIGIQ